MLRLASLTSDGTGTVNYTYDTYGKLTTISRGTTSYNFTYDAWGRIVDTKVGAVTLSTNEYGTNLDPDEGDVNFGQLMSVTYGNGFVTEYSYDSLDRVSTISQRLTANGSALPAYSFTYNNEGDLYALYNYKTDRVTFFEYDHAGRCMASTEKSFTHTGGSFAVTSLGAVVSACDYEYDSLNRLSKLTCAVSGSQWETVYTYDDDGRALTTTLDNGKVITNTYDAVGRLTRKRIGLTSNYDTALTYLTGPGGSQTALVATYKNGSNAEYNYTYDENGNILTIAQDGDVTYYQYDAANQLIREDNATLNQSWTYTYDSWGNLLNKKRYAYVANGGTLGSCQETIQPFYRPLLV